VCDRERKGKGGEKCGFKYPPVFKPYHLPAGVRWVMGGGGGEESVADGQIS
jgi:hypothetical protein